MATLLLHSKVESTGLYYIDRYGKEQSTLPLTSLKAQWPAWTPRPRKCAVVLYAPQQYAMRFYGHLCFAYCATVLTNPEPCKLVAAVHLLCPPGNDTDYILYKKIIRLKTIFSITNG